MVRALYTATSGMMVESRRLDLMAKNLFFAQIPGYKSIRVLRAAQAPTDPRVPADVQTTYVGEFHDPAAGALRPTGKPLDLAIEGDGLFAVETPGGVGYTRDGRFARGRDGTVVNANGHRLLGADGPLTFPADSPAEAPVKVEDDGTFRVGGKEAGGIRMGRFPGYRGLRAAGGSLFYPTGAVAAQPVEGRVVQGALEDSNSSVVAEMTKTIETLRAFESYQKVVRTVMEEVTGEAVRRLGRVA